MTDDDEVMAGFKQKTPSEKEAFVDGIQSEINDEGRRPIDVELLSLRELDEFIFEEISFRNPARENELRELAKARGQKLTSLFNAE